MKKLVKVVAVIIENVEIRFYVPLRSPELSILKEFPGGKIEKNENIQHLIENFLKI